MSYKPARILVWDDRNTAVEAVTDWLKDVPRHTWQLHPTQLWSEAIRKLQHEGPWDVVVADLLDDTYIETKLGEYQRAWRDCVRNPAVQELTSSPFPSLKPESWQAAHFWGTGMLLLASALHVPEIFVVSGYVLSGNVGAAAVDADSIVISLSNVGALKGGVLDKFGSSWSRTQLRTAVLRHTEDARRIIPNQYAITTSFAGSPSRTLSRNCQSTWQCRIVDRETNVAGDLHLTTDHMLLLKTLSVAEGQWVSGIELLDTLNNHRSLGSGTDQLTIVERRSLFAKLGVQLKGEEPGNRLQKMCRTDNDVICPWRRGAQHVPSQRDEGYGCYVATRTDKISSGFCPKGLMKSAAGDFLDLDGGASRRKVHELRLRLSTLENVFGNAFAGPDGLVRSLRTAPRGYALAGRLQCEES